jgi:hypothetical protein
MTVRGPENRATRADCPGRGEWLAIRFKVGTFMPELPIARIVDRQDVDLPRASTRAFWLDGAAWEYPTFENAEVFVKRLVQRGLIGWDPVVDGVLHDRQQDLSMRSVQRRFLRATAPTPRFARSSAHARPRTF